MKYFSLGGGGTDGTTQSLPWIECASSRSTPGSSNKQMLNDQFKEIFYRWKFLWGFRKHQCCYCCCCCCHVFLAFFTPWPATYFLICCKWKNEFCLRIWKNKWNIQKISYFRWRSSGRRGTSASTPRQVFFLLKIFFLLFSKKCPRSWKYCFFHRTFQTLNISISMTLLKLLSLQGFILPFKNLNTYVCRRTHRRRNPWSPLVS